MNNGDISELDELKSFKYSVNNFCCCRKLIDLYLDLTKSAFNLYKDKEKKKIFLSIPREKIIAINKRQIDKYDVFKLSVYYQLAQNEPIKEIKLKANSRADTDKWIKILRNIIKPKKYYFVYNEKTQDDASLLFPVGDTKQFYLSMCHLEYILCKGKMSDFFRYYSEKRAQLNDSEVLKGGHLDEENIEMEIV